jgi:hypothetical protein
MFNGPPQVRLTSVTSDGNGTEDVAFDAIAIDEIPGSYEEHTVEAVALFDENQDIDTDPVSTWWIDTPLKSRQALYDWALATSGAVTSLPECASGLAATCVAPAVRDAIWDWRNQVISAGTDASTIRQATASAPGSGSPTRTTTAWVPQLRVDIVGGFVG